MFGDSEAEDGSGGSDVGVDVARPTSSAVEGGHGLAMDKGEADHFEGDCKRAASRAEAEEGNNQVDRRYVQPNLHH